ncbi:N-acetyltransferase [Streptomyces mashuensis]|uniref:N-acetyltransferase n=1 Tax=Streptomyces mashuensis TaxID=33904 RepID=A0A919AWE6_9ACTN|nr:GNAT family protein [Streptomyces mashuensis]GHF26400.1 N-acetyltransferase [Streptomyces mashuensis]
MTTILRTPRLTLRRWREDDIEPLAALGPGGDPAAARDDIAAWEREWEERGVGMFAVELRETRRLAGVAGLSVPAHLPAVLPAVALGWRLGAVGRERGLDVEAARAVLDFALRDRGVARVVAVHAVGDAGSERVLRALGMRPEGETADPRCGGRLRVHVLEACP